LTARNSESASAPLSDRPVLLRERSAPLSDRPVLLRERSAPLSDRPVLLRERSAPLSDHAVCVGKRLNKNKHETAIHGFKRFLLLFIKYPFLVI
jgi:hypothetical protein